MAEFLRFFVRGARPFALSQSQLKYGALDVRATHTEGPRIQHGMRRAAVPWSMVELPTEGDTFVSITRRVPIVLSEYQREQLIRWTTSPGSQPRVVRRSRIILQLASGYSVHRASQVLNISEPTIRLWRDRFRYGGLEALTTDAPRPGRPRRARDQARIAVSERLAGLPTGAPISVRALARDTGLGRHLVQQVLLDMGVLTDRKAANLPADDSDPDSIA